MYACLHAPGNLAALVECAREFSPYFEEISADAVLVDLRGLRLLFGSPDDIALAMTNRAGITVNLAIAYDTDTQSSPHVAIRASRLSSKGRKDQRSHRCRFTSCPVRLSQPRFWTHGGFGRWANSPGCLRRESPPGWAKKERICSGLRGAQATGICARSPALSPLNRNSDWSLLWSCWNPCHSCSGGFSESCAVRLIRIP
jgi:hypothetical protein